MPEWIEYKPKEYVPVSRWGKDHWSTFGYLETRAVDYGGIIENCRMRCDKSLHPQFAHWGSYGGKYPTILKDGRLDGHDDWSCVEDMAAAGLVKFYFDFSRAKIEFTPLGWEIASQLRIHKANGGNFNGFNPTWPPSLPPDPTPLPDDDEPGLTE